MKKGLLLTLCIYHSTFVTPQSWQQQPGFPGLERDDAVSTSIGDKAFYGLGFATGFVCMNDWWSFDKTNGWQQKSNFPGAPRQYAAAVAVGSYVYVFGGIDQNIISLNDFWRYDSENDSWEELDTLPSIGRQAPVIIPLHDKLLVGLGRNNITYFSDFWLYNPNTNSFEQIASLPTAGRYYAVANNVAGNAMVAHGWNQSQCFNDVWKYDEVNNTWIQQADSPSDGCNYVCGGNVKYDWIIGTGKDYSNNYLKSFYQFNLSTNSWKSLPDLPAIERKGSSIFVLDEEIYLVGGIDPTSTRLNEVWKLSLPQNEVMDMAIVPNPADNYTHIYLPEKAIDKCKSQIGISIYDIAGRKVLEESFDFGSWYSFDVSTFSSGLYLIHIENCTGIKVGKMVVE